MIATPSVVFWIPELEPMRAREVRHRRRISYIESTDHKPLTMPMRAAENELTELGDLPADAFVARVHTSECIIQ
jgi:hypothetical protein